MITSFHKRLYKMASSIAFAGAAFSYALPAQAQLNYELEPPARPQTVIPQAISQNVGAHNISITPSNSLGSERPIAASADQEFCITVMSGFPNNGAGPRYQFFKLVQDISIDATPDFQRVLSTYGDNSVDANTPIMDVIENVANPVLRQALPELTIGNMAHLIDFNMRCSENITGQIDSLLAFDDSIDDNNHVIDEDALFLRQILLESLIRQGADNDPNSSQAMQAYDTALLTTRNNIEFKSFDDEISSLESLYMTDLDGRLARSNDIINSEMDNEVLGTAITLSDDMNETAHEAQRRGMLETLIYILQ